MKKMKVLASLLSVAMIGASLVACGTTGTPAEKTSDDMKKDETPAAVETVKNSEKPLVWYNRQPSNSSTGALDQEALSFNSKTAYVGFDANQGAELQGQMISKYITDNIATLDRNGDGIIGYVLAIGDIGHNDSIARTRGVRKALGTAVEKDGLVVSDPVGTNTDGASSLVKDGELEVGGKKYVVRELASQEMKNNTGATWDAATAGNTISTWAASFGEQIDVIASNNDGMGMAMFTGWSKENNVPTFGYDANSDAVAAIAEGYGGTISQHADVQAYLTLRVLRNALDNGDMDLGIGKADEAGNTLTSDVFMYKADEHSYYALNVAVTKDNYQNFLDSTVPYEPVAKQLDASAHPEKKVWLSVYNSADNFLGSTYQPLLEKYAKLLNLKLEVVLGDGQSESSLTNRFTNPSEYDAYAINMVKTDNAASYLSLLQ